MRRLQMSIFRLERVFWELLFFPVEFPLRLWPPLPRPAPEIFWVATGVTNMASAAPASSSLAQLSAWPSRSIGKEASTLKSPLFPFVSLASLASFECVLCFLWRAPFAPTPFTTALLDLSACCLVPPRLLGPTTTDHALSFVSSPFGAADAKVPPFLLFLSPMIAPAPRRTPRSRRLPEVSHTAERDPPFE